MKSPLTQFILHYQAGFVIIEPHTVLPVICRDKDDNNVLQLVESVKADYLITGDKDLLVLDNFKSAKIVNPGTFLDQFVSK